MASTTRRISVSLFLGALIVLILSSGFYSNNDFSPSSLFTGSHAVFKHESVVALVESRAAVLSQKIAIPFGSSNGLRLSRSLKKAAIRRDDWLDNDPTW